MPLQSADIDTLFYELHENRMPLLQSGVEIKLLKPKIMCVIPKVLVIIG